MSEVVSSYNSYTLFKNAAYAVKSSLINDSIGQVLFTFKSTPYFKYVDDLGEIKNSGDGNPEILQFGINDQTKTDCFYKLLQTRSKYTFYWMTADGKFDEKNKKLPDTSINVYKIELGANKRILEVRVNDPVCLVELELSPVVPFFSIAYSNTERQSIQTLINDPNNFIPGSKVYFKFDSPVTPVQTTGYRDYYEFELKLIGSVKSGSSIIESPTPIGTGITVRSVDGQNFFSNAYANAAFPLITGQSWNNIIWDNRIIPEATAGTTNPFAGYWTSPPGNGLKDKLQAIINEANDLPIIGTNSGKNLLSGEIRDSIYKGNIEQVTFEMAFRLPFYSVNMDTTPYTLSNNPYYSRFDSWLLYANTIRDNSGFPVNKNLGRTGFRKEFSSAIQNAQDHLKLYALFGVTRNNSLTNHNIPAYMAAIMNDENSHKKFDQYFTVPSGISPNLRQNDQARMDARTEVSTSGLLTIKTQGYILQSSYDNLIGAPTNTFVGEPIQSAYASNANGYYIFKSAIDDKFYIYNKLTARYWAGISGITIAFGYDMGSRNKDIDYSPNTDDVKFLYITGLNITGTTETIVKEGFGKQGIRAVALFYTYFETIFNALTIDYDYAVSHAQPFIKKEYLAAGVSATKGLRKANFDFFKVYEPTPGGLEFYDSNSNQYLNEIEKYFFGTQLYNVGKGGFDPDTHSRSARYFTHSINTHDIRWLKQFVRGRLPLNTAMWRRKKLRKLLDVLVVYNHYKIDQNLL